MVPMYRRTLSRLLAPTSRRLSTGKEAAEQADDVLSRHGGKIALVALSAAGYLFWSFYKVSSPGPVFLSCSRAARAGPSWRRSWPRLRPSSRTRCRS